MSSEHRDRKQKVKHEFFELSWLFLYLAFFFCALVAYDTLLLRQYQVEYWNFGFAVLNAFVITKVITIGEYAKVGRMHESKGVFISALWKAFVFFLLVFGFHLIEEVVKRFTHGAEVTIVSREIRFDQLASRAIVVFCIFVPLFAFREFRRVMGEDEFSKLVFHARTERS